MFHSPRLNKTVFLSILAASMVITGLSWKGCAFSAPSQDKNIVAVVNNKIFITKPELDEAIVEYKAMSKKKDLTKEEKIHLVRNLIRRQLILKLDKVEAYRKDPDTIRKVKAYEDNVIVARYLREVIVPQLNVSEEETRAYYDKHRHEFSTPPKVEASQILLRSRQDAEMVLKKLHEGADFAQLAKQYSIDLPMALEGGKMGTIEKGKTLPALDKALFLLAQGETSGIVETKFGYHILRVDKIIPAGFKSYDEVHDQIQRTLMQEKEKKAFRAMVRHLEKNAKIKIFESRLGTIQQASSKGK